MKIASFIPSMAGLIVLMIPLASCTGLLKEPQPTPTPEAMVPAPAPLPPPNWADLLGETSAPRGWEVVPCENPALLCIKAGSETVGTVEMFISPLAEAQLQMATPETDLEEIPSDLETLKGWVVNHYNTIKDDRTLATPNLVFLSKPAEEVAVGDLSGLRYAFTIRHSNDTLAERAVGYVATDGTALYVFATGVINGDPTGSFSSDAALREFEPHLALIMADLSL